MKLLGLAVLGVFAAIGALAIAGFALAALSTQDSSFETYEGLASSGLVERGWVPEGIPRSVRSIKELHDISANTARASFAYDPADVQTTRQICKVLVESKKGATFLCPPFDGRAFIVVLRVDGKGSWELVDAV